MCVCVFRGLGVFNAENCLSTVLLNTMNKTLCFKLLNLHTYNNSMCYIRFIIILRPDTESISTDATKVYLYPPHAFKIFF